MKLVAIQSAEKRTAPRMKSLMAARISYAGGNAVIDCIVRNISDTGAKIAVSSAVTLPEEFDLIIPQRNTVQRVRMQWRRAEAIGVAFASAEPASRAESGEEALRQRIRELEGTINQMRTRIMELTGG